MTSSRPRCAAVVDLAAVAHNVRRLRGLLTPATAMMAVVKADGYGHGAVQVARAALAGGADQLGVATLPEALELRTAGITAPIGAWLWPATEDPGPALRAGVQVAVSSLEHLSAILDAASGVRPQVLIKVDSGLGRNGAYGADIGPLLTAAAAAERAGRITVAGLMSHLAGADVPGDPSVARQADTFAAIRAAAADAGINAPASLANTAATIDHPELHLDQVRVGIGVYGLEPTPTKVGLRPAMTLQATVALTKRVPAGQGVSYNHTYVTARETTLALVPMGYADGVPRLASGRAEVLVAGRRLPIVGRVAMDQFVVDCGDLPVHAGDPVLLFGPGDTGEPTAKDWAGWCETIDYEIVTRIGPRTPRRWIEAQQQTSGPPQAPSQGREAGPPLGPQGAHRAQGAQGAQQ